MCLPSIVRQCCWHWLMYCTLGKRHSWGPAGLLSVSRATGHDSQPLICLSSAPVVHQSEMSLPEAEAQLSHGGLTLDWYLIMLCPLPGHQNTDFTFRFPVSLIKESNPSISHQIQQSLVVMSRKVRQLQTWAEQVCPQVCWCYLQSFLCAHSQVCASALYTLRAEMVHAGRCSFNKHLLILPWHYMTIHMADVSSPPIFKYSHACLNYGDALRNASSGNFVIAWTT